MKNFVFSLIFVLAIFLTGCVANNAQRGAMIGGAGGAIGAQIGKAHTKNTLLYSGGAALLGYIIGNEMDKQEPNNNHMMNNNRMMNNNHMMNQPYNTYNNKPYNLPVTKCKKIVTRKTVNGKLVETIEEVCEGNKTENTY